MEKISFGKHYGQLQRRQSVEHLHQLRATGVTFKVKHLGYKVVPKDTREQQRATVDAIRELGAEHAKSAKKKSLFLVISVDGVKLLDEQSKHILDEHKINRISQCAHDLTKENKEIISYVVYHSASDQFHAHVFAFKPEAKVIHRTMCQAFDEAFRMRNERNRRNAERKPLEKPKASPPPVQPRSPIKRQPSFTTDDIAGLKSKTASTQAEMTLVASTVPEMQRMRSHSNPNRQKQSAAKPPSQDDDPFASAFDALASSRSPIPSSTGLSSASTVATAATTTTAAADPFKALGSPPAPRVAVGVLSPPTAQRQAHPPVQQQLPQQPMPTTDSLIQF